MKWLATLGILIFVAFLVAYFSPFTNYPPYRYRLQLAVEIDGKIHTGSSIIEVRCGSSDFSPGSDMSGSACSTGGQAVVVDLGPKGLLVATLFTGYTTSPVPDGAVEARFLCANAFGNGSSRKELPSLAHMHGRRNLSSTNFPRLLWFSNPTDIKSAQKITKDELSTIIDPSARLVEAFVEITQEPVKIDIDRKLVWFSALVEKQRNGSISYPNQLNLNYSMFVGQDSIGPFRR
jgi:hypothetical protein